MRCILQAALLLAAISFGALAQDGEPAFRWEPPKVKESLFGADLGLLESEREDYATNLSIIATNHVVDEKGAAPALQAARRMIGLALQLSPRNKRAVVTNFQLAKGVLPESASGTYTRQTFARLLLTRGQLLEKQGGDGNRELAQYFIELAAELDPKNEDAVYASEVQRLDHGALNWSKITDPEKKGAEK